MANPALRAGFIGLGNIGQPMAERLVAAGIPTVVFDVAEAPLGALVAAGAARAASPRAVAEASDVVGVCVRDDAGVREVLTGSDGLLAGARAGSVIAIHSTVLPRTVVEMGTLAAARGVGLVDACITGGQAGARQGTLTYMVGGSVADLERCRPAFATSATKVVHCGELGRGAATKLCNNLMTYLGFLAAFEATTLARAAGLSQQTLEEVTRANGNMNDQMLAFLALHKLPVAQLLDAGMQQHLRSFTDLAEKDLALTLEFAREHGVALPGTGLCQQLMARVYGLQDDKRR
jgi:3-hydroxyisobutyrate dehydrogenase